MHQLRFLHVPQLSQKDVLPNEHTTSNPRRFDVDIMSIRRIPNFDDFPRHFRLLFRCTFDDRKIRVFSTYLFWRNLAGKKICVISPYVFGCNFDDRKIHIVSMYFFDVILMVEKSTLFPRTLFDEISMVKKSMLFPSTFVGVILPVEKSTLFTHTFFDVISMVRKSTLFPRTFSDVICLVKICTLFLLTFFDIILVDKNSASFLVSCKLIKTFEKVFPVFVTLNSWFLQNCSLQIFLINTPGVVQFHWNLSLTTSTTAKRTVAS